MSQLQVQHVPIARYSSLKSRQGAREGSSGGGGSGLACFGDTIALNERDGELRCDDFGGTMSTFEGHFGDTQELGAGPSTQPFLEGLGGMSPEASMEEGLRSPQRG